MPDCIHEELLYRPESDTSECVECGQQFNGVPPVERLIPKCGSCGRERQLTDVNDYNPLQVVMGAPIGWYHTDEEGDICGDCMTTMIRGQR